MTRRLTLYLFLPALLLASDELNQQLNRIFGSEDFKIKAFGPARWIEDGAAYTTVENSSIVRYQTASGERSVLITREQLTPNKAAKALDVEDYFWNADSQKLLVYTASKKVWRQKSRGDYWVLDRATGTLKKLGGNAAPSTLMFAKFSPDGSRVAYVRENNLYCEDLSSGAIKALTTDGSATTINGTFDWVYEEEFKLRDGFRWSPDGRRIAFWNFDTTGIQQFALIDNTSERYPKITNIPYPQTGGINSAARIGVVNADGGAPRWMEIPGDPRNHYLFRVTWNDANELLIGQLNRLQNTMTLFLANAATGAVKPMFRDQDAAWVDVRGDRPDVPVLKSPWLNNGRNLLWFSERDGWNHIYSLSREDGAARLLTTGQSDTISLEAIDEKGGWLYTIASPDNATQRYLHRVRLDHPGPGERVTPASLPGTHSYIVSPDCRWALHTYSTFERPPVTDLVSLPDHKSIRMLDDNANVREQVDKLANLPAEFLKVTLANGVTLDGFMLKPPAFDPARKYPVIVYVYGEPANASVVDRWGAERALFHRALAKDGYLIVCFDNRSTPAPKGREWRKVIYKNLGVIPPNEQAEALHLLMNQRKYIDQSRVGVWGWSSGGCNTLNLMFRSPDTYHVGVAVAPVTDLSLYDTIYLERYMGLPEVNAAEYKRASSINFAEGLKGKLLIVHGSGDDNVHYQGTEMLINRLIELDKPFEFMEYPNRSHSINEGKGTSLHLHRLIARYLEEHLPAGPRESHFQTVQNSNSKSPFEGSWIIETPGGPRPLEGTFQVNGTELTGTMRLGAGSVVPISSGKVEGNNISLQFPGENGRTLFLSGTLEGEVIQMELKLDPKHYGSPYTAKRKPAKA